MARFLQTVDQNTSLFNNSGGVEGGAGARNFSFTLKNHSEIFNQTNHTTAFLHGSNGTNIPDGNPFYGSNSSANSGAATQPPIPGNNAYEFVAFLLWYIFLVLCCIVPTCFAYRRRRLLETRVEQQQENMNRLQQSNIIVLSNFHQHQQQYWPNEEVLQSARAQAITKVLQKSTMTVKERDLYEASLGGIDSSGTAINSSLQPRRQSLEATNSWNRGHIISLHDKSSLSSSSFVEVALEESSKNQEVSDSVVNKEHDHLGTSSAPNDQSAPCTTAALSRETEHVESAQMPNRSNLLNEAGDPDFDYDEHGNYFLKLPSSTISPDGGIEAKEEQQFVNANRIVAGTCAICLCQYQPDDKVSWSPNAACRHAFHTDCIIPWLAKKVDQQFNCPICRQEFCFVTIDNETLRSAGAGARPMTQILVRFPPFGRGYPEFMQATGLTGALTTGTVLPAAHTITSSRAMSATSTAAPTNPAPHATGAVTDSRSSDSNSNSRSIFPPFSSALEMITP